MNNIEKSIKKWLKRKVKVTNALIVLFLITGGIGYAEAREPEMRELVHIMQTELSNSYFNNENDMLNAAKNIYYTKLAKEESQSKLVEIKNSFKNDKKNEIVEIKIKTANKSSNIIFQELQNQIKKKNPRTLEKLLAQPYYKNPKLTVKQWSNERKIEIIELNIEDCDPLLRGIFPVAGSAIITGAVLLNEKDKKTPKKPILKVEPKPPVVEPPVIEPPIIEPPVVEPPVEPPVVEPPIIEPPIIEPPVVEPPIEPPVVEPPIIEPPIEPPGLPYIWENEESVGDNVRNYLNENFAYSLTSVGEGTLAVINENSGLNVNLVSDGAKASEGSTIINKGTIIIDGIDLIGMRSSGLGSTVINDGSIEIEGSNVYGMLSNIDSLAENKGVINTNGSNNNGMLAHNDGTLINNNIINVNGSNNNGMFAWNSSRSTNNKIINVYGTDNNGTFATNYSTVTNNYEINVNNDGNNGMYGANESVSINEGTININKNNSIAMGSQTKAKIVNNGTINVFGNENIGMSISLGGVGINNGKIYLNNGTNGIGMKADGSDSIIQNFGEIHLGDNIIVSDDQNQINLNNGNQAFLLTNGAIIDNSGTFSVAGAFDTEVDIAGDGTGKFVVSGGTVEADSIKGDFYASGALAMGSYSDTQDTYRLFKTENMYANIKSNSAMYDVALKEKDSNGYYGIEMTRKNFNEIINNSSFATYLENNYTADGGTQSRMSLYDALKLQSTETNLNKVTNNLQGSTIYPAFTYQTLSNIRGINKDIHKEILNKQLTDLEEIRILGFGNYRNSDVKMGSAVEDYTANLSTVTLGFDIAITDYTRLGILGTAGKSSYEFDSKDKRNDDVYQGNIIGTFDNDNGIIATISAFVGRAYGDIKRKLNIGTTQEDLKGDLDTKYYGADIGLEKRYEGDVFNITPRIELNVTQINFSEVKESGTYALDVKSLDSTSVESGIGFTIDTIFETENNVRFIPSLKAMYYREFANPYKDLNAKMSSFSEDTFIINGYNGARDRGEFSAGLRIENDFIHINGGVEFIIDDKGQQLRPFVGVGYNF